MTQIHKSRASDNPHIDRIWRSQNITDGVYSATPDGSWDLIVMIDRTGARQMALTGQATKPMQVPYQAGTGSVVISFVPGAYLPHYPAEALLDSIIFLPNFDDEHFNIAGHTFAFPTFEDAEVLVEKMVLLGILKNDSVVDGVSKGTPRAASSSTTQRHFVRTTGLTQKYLAQIRQAQRAIRLLQEGKKPIDAAIDSGYTDQSHLAKSLKKIMDAKPSDVDDIHKL
jgi:hypothetical protein